MNLKDLKKELEDNQLDQLELMNSIEKYEALSNAAIGRLAIIRGREHELIYKINILK